MQFKPHNYQAYCIGRVIQDKALGLLLDMGLGKTIITLSAINDLKFNRFEIARVLVIAPKKVAERTWSKEAEQWDHTRHLRIVPILGTLTQRVKKLNTPADIYVINRENVVWLVEYYKNAWPFDMVVIDESSSFKSHNAKRFKALKAVRDKISRIVELTGTPSPNGLLDLWAQVYLLDKGERLEKNITQYREKYFRPDRRDRTTVFSYAPKDASEEAIHKRISDICISMKSEDYLELPECTTDIIPVRLDSKARREYDEMEKNMLLNVDESTIDATTAAVLTNKLLQLCNGAVYDENKKVVTVHDCKIEAFKETLERLNGKSAIVYYSFQHDVPRLMAAAEALKLRCRVLKTPEDEDAWNNRQVDVLLAHPASCGYGLNLQFGGNHVIWFGLNWSLELYLQANKRLHRQGQKEKVILHHLVVEGGMDEDVLAALEGKTQVQNRLLEALKARIEKYKG